MTRNARMVVMAAQGRDSFSATQLHALEAAMDVTFHAVPGQLTHDRMRDLCADAEIIGFTRRATLNFDARLIDSLPSLRAVAVYATGSDWLDRDTLTQRGIRLALLPDYSTRSVAEHTLGLMLTLSRRLHLSDRISRGELPRSVSMRGFELSGKTLGIIGYGRIGQAVARLACAFGMRVLAHDLSVKPITTEVEHVSQQELLAASDMVVLACSLTRGAAPLIDGSVLTAMKAGALLINPSRSALVDNAAVLQAILERRLRGYAVDDAVFSAEQLALVEHGRILQSAHTAWYSDEAMARGTQAWVEALVELAAWLGAEHGALRQPRSARG